MSVYTPSGAYRQELDIRCPAGRVPGWARPLAEGRPPNDSAWLVVMGRRAGKTWLARGISQARGPQERTRLVDLRPGPSAARKAGVGCLLGGASAPAVPEDVLLVDEPALPEGQDKPAAALARGLRALRDAGVVPVVFATPNEYSMLIGHLGPDAPKDVIMPPSLEDAEIARMTARAPDWAPGVAAALRAYQAEWLRTPFLLELALHIAEDDPDLRSDIPRLATTAIDTAIHEHQYREQLFGKGLAAGQRAALRASRWRAAGISIPGTEQPGVLARTPIPDDPVIADHLPEVLRIHHISDLHQGGSLRATVDAKDRGGTGRGLARLAGEGTPLTSYLDHLRQLSANGMAPHLLIVSGDIVDRAGDDEQGRQALSWLRSIEPHLADHPDLREDDPRVVLVGGNHDVAWDRCLDSHGETRHEWFAATFGDYPHPDLHLPEHRDRRLFLKYHNAALRIALLGSAESGGEPAHDDDRERLRSYLERLANANDEDDVGELVRSFERVDPGIVAREILDRLTPAESYLTIATLHHPVSPVPTVEVSPYSGLVNAGQVKRALIAARTALVLHGHTHLSFLSAERLLAPSHPWTLRIVGAPTLASTATDEQNGFNEILIAREGSTHRLLVRPVRLDGGQWLPQEGVSFQPGAPGECGLPDLVLDP